MSYSANKDWTEVRFVAVIALAALAFWQTNPSHLRHFSKLNPISRMPLELIDVTPLPPAERMRVEKNHPVVCDTDYHDYYLFSTTTSRGDGGLHSLGLLRMVFDLRSKK